MNGKFVNNPRRAIIVGSGGQDGTYLTQYLTSLGYMLSQIGRHDVIDEAGKRSFDILDVEQVRQLVHTVAPDEIYYLAAHHHSSQQATESLQQLIAASYRVHCEGLGNFLDVISELSLTTRLFYAASSLVFGEPDSSPQNEATPMAPVCAYGITKSMGVNLCRLYRRERNVFAVAGMLFNHESPLRAPQFITKKIVQAVCAVTRDPAAKLEIGNLDAVVDWSFAGDFVLAMHAMLQIDTPEDFVIASGRAHRVRDFARLAFETVQLDYRDHVVKSASPLHRPPRKVPLVGDARRLVQATGWTARMPLEELVGMMVETELKKGRVNV